MKFLSILSLASIGAAAMAQADSDKDGGVSFDETRVFKVAKWRKMRGEASIN